MRQMKSPGQNPAIKKSAAICEGRRRPMLVTERDDETPRKSDREGGLHLPGERLRLLEVEEPNEDREDHLRDLEDGLSHGKRRVRAGPILESEAERNHYREERNRHNLPTRQGRAHLLLAREKHHDVGTDEGSPVPRHDESRHRHPIDSEVPKGETCHTPDQAIEADPYKNVPVFRLTGLGRLLFAAEERVNERAAEADQDTDREPQVEELLLPKEEVPHHDRDDIIHHRKQRLPAQADGLRPPHGVDRETIERSEATHECETRVEHDGSASDERHARGE